MRFRAIVFDLMYTLVHPGLYPNSSTRVGWLAELLGLDAAVLSDRWKRFEPILESGQAPRGGAVGTSPELTWICAVAEDIGVLVTPGVRATIVADWDLAHRDVLLHPPAESTQTLTALRARGLRLGLLSNTHGLEVRAWEQSPLARMFDAECFSHEIGVMKPDPESYATVLRELGVTAAQTAFVGDGGSGELAGARTAGFGLVVFAQAAPSQWWPEQVPMLAEQADATITSLSELVPLVEPF